MLERINTETHRSREPPTRADAIKNPRSGYWRYIIHGRPRFHVDVHKVYKDLVMMFAARQGGVC